MGILKSNSSNPQTPLQALSRPYQVFSKLCLLFYTSSSSLPPHHLSTLATIVTKASRRTLAQPTKPLNPARSFNERGQGLIRKLFSYSQSLYNFGVEVSLLIKTLYTEYTYKSKDDILRYFTTNLANTNRYRP